MVHPWYFQVQLILCYMPAEKTAAPSEDCDSCTVTSHSSSVHAAVQILDDSCSLIQRQCFAAEIGKRDGNDTYIIVLAVHTFAVLGAIDGGLEALTVLL